MLTDRSIRYIIRQLENGRSTMVVSREFPMLNYRAKEGGFITDQTVNRTASRTASRVVSGEHSVKRQAWTEVEGVVSEKAHVVRLWDDV